MAWNEKEPRERIDRAPFHHFDCYWQNADGVVVLKTPRTDRNDKRRHQQEASVDNKPRFFRTDTSGTIESPLRNTQL